MIIITTISTEQKTDGCRGKERRAFALRLLATLAEGHVARHTFSRLAIATKKCSNANRVHRTLQINCLYRMLTFFVIYRPMKNRAGPVAGGQGPSRAASRASPGVNAAAPNNQVRVLINNTL